MESTIVHIINNKLHNFKYLNYTIIFYIIVLYTYYSLFVYLLNKNYIMLLLYFIFFLVLYNFYKNFTYIIGFFFLSIFKIFNIDTIVNSNSINLVNKFINVNIENLALMDKVRAKSNAKESELNDNADNAKKKKGKRNPAKEHIINALQKAGIKISNEKYNHESKKDSAESDLNNILAGHHSVQRPIINNNMSY